MAHINSLTRKGVETLVKHTSNPRKKDTSSTKDFIYGRHPVYECLRAGRRVFYTLLFADGIKTSSLIRGITDLADTHSVPTQHVPRAMLNDLAHTPDHQGVLLKTGPYPYAAELDDILKLAEERDEPPFLLLLDLLKDPQNVGALMRAAEAVGIHGVVIQDRRAVEITPAVVSASSGAVEHLQVIRVRNLVNTMRQMKDNEIWLAAMDANADSQTIDKADLKGAVGLVLGSEGEGLRRLVRETCDFSIQLPMRGKIASLNVATAGAVGLYAIWQARGWQGWSA